MANKHIGSNFDDFLQEEGILVETEASAVKKVISSQLQQIMRKKHISKIEMAQKMKTSRAALDRLLEPDNVSITLLTLERAALALGKKLKIRLA